MEYFRVVISPRTNSTKMAGNAKSSSPRHNSSSSKKVINLNVNKLANKGSGGLDGVLRNLIRATLPSWTRTTIYLQLLRDEEHKTAKLKLYSLASRVVVVKDDPNIPEHSKELFKDAAPFSMKDFSQWILSRSLVHKHYGVIHIDLASHDPVDCKELFPKDPSSGIRCSEIFLCITVDGYIPGDITCSSESAMAFVRELINSEQSVFNIHAFSVATGSVVVTREKLQERCCLTITKKVN